MSEHSTTENHDFPAPEEGELENEWGPIITNDLIVPLDDIVGGFNSTGTALTVDDIVANTEVESTTVRPTDKLVLPTGDWEE